MDFIEFMGDELRSRYPERDGVNYLPHITAEYDGKSVIDVEAYQNKEFTISTVCVTKDGEDGDSHAMPSSRWQGRRNPMANPEISVERLTEYSFEDAAGIGRLMPFLSERLSPDPIPEDLLREIINSPHHEQLVARLDSLIVGGCYAEHTDGAGRWQGGLPGGFRNRLRA